MGHSLPVPALPCWDGDILQPADDRDLLPPVSQCVVSSAEPLPPPGWVRLCDSPGREGSAAALSCDKSPQHKHSTHCPLPGCKSAAAGTRASYQDRPHPSVPSSALVLPPWDCQERKRMLGHLEPAASSGTMIPAGLCTLIIPAPSSASLLGSAPSALPHPGIITSMTRTQFLSLSLEETPSSFPSLEQDNCDVFL